MVRKPFIFCDIHQKNYVVKLLGSWDDGKPIADPYYGGVVCQLAYPSFLFQRLLYDRMVLRPALNNARDIRMPFSMRWSQSKLKALCDETSFVNLAPLTMP